MVLRSTRSSGTFLQQHSLSLVVIAILALWIALYSRADPETHIGAFYGNAIADWTGTLVIVVLTKYLFEKGSKESRAPRSRGRSRIGHVLQRHSLTIVLAITGIAWAIAYARMDNNGKVGQVVGNIVSEWTQVLGLVVITKYTREVGSKESR
jgi:hypothetical protein